MTQQLRPRPAFTLIELLVVIAIIALLIGILLPSLAAARTQARTIACTSQLRQLAIATLIYTDDADQHLPQVLVPGFDGDISPVGALFGGKKGQLPFLGINEYGAERRPLNSYVSSSTPPPDLNPDGTPSDTNPELPIFNSPLDNGAGNTGVPGFESTNSMYELLGASYTLNDHALDANPFADEIPTLIPDKGGRMPSVLDTTHTWMLATHTIYNDDDGGNEQSHREYFWFGKQTIKANIAFLDGHASAATEIARGQVNTTDDYTFYPEPSWPERFNNN